jgi:hypothetical protein
LKLGDSLEELFVPTPLAFGPLVQVSVLPLLLDHVAPLAARVPGSRDRPLCPKRVIPPLHVNLAVRPDNEPVARSSRHIHLPTADDEQVIAGQIVFDPMRVEELKESGVVVLVDLDTADHVRFARRIYRWSRSVAAPADGGGHD